MQFHLILLALIATLFSLLAIAQTPECTTEDTCFSEGPNHIDLKRGVAVINAICTSLTGNYFTQE